MLAISYIGDERERDILGRLYVRNYAAMLHRVQKIVPALHDAEDVVADAMLSLTDKVHKLAAMSDCECAAYMVRTAERQAYKHNKGAWRRKVTQLLETVDYDLPAPVTIEPEELVLLYEKKEALGRGMAQLSERDRMLLVYRYYVGMSNREIARIMGIREANVKKYMYIARRRALPLLKEVLHNENDG